MNKNVIKKEQNQQMKKVSDCRITKLQSGTFIMEKQTTSYCKLVVLTNLYIYITIKLLVFIQPYS